MLILVAVLRGLCCSHVMILRRRSRQLSCIGAGAGDRLGLKCEVTGESVPTAMLPYCGRTLLSGLIRDLQAGPFCMLAPVMAMHSLQWVASQICNSMLQGTSLQLTQG